MGKEVELGEAAAFGLEATDLKGDQFLDVTEVARKAGFLCQVFISQLIHEQCRGICSGDANCTDEDRLWMFLFGLQRNQSEPPDDCMKRWSCMFTMIDDWHLGKVKVVRSFNDKGARAIALMLP